MLYLNDGFGQDRRFDETFDVVVVGSGAAGLTAAFVAAVRGGCRVLVVEKTGFYGGTTAYSGGGLWLPGNPKMNELGSPDSREQGERYIRECLGELYQEDRTSAYLDSSPEMVKWMEENSAVKFVGIHFPDYHMDLAGAAYGRTVMTKPYDGRRLGRLVRQIRYPLQGTAAFGSMQVDLADINTWKTPWGSWNNFTFCTNNLSRYAVDLLRYGKGTVLCNGNALVGRLLESVSGAGVTLWSNAPAVEPIVHNGQVSGLLIQKDGRKLQVQAKKGVVLASGGFARSAALSRKYLPNCDYTAAPRGNQGDGLRLGVASGGILGTPNEDNGLWAPISQYQTRNGQIRYFPHQALDRSKPGCIIVDGDGRRFANESAPYQPFGHNTHAAGVKKHYLVGDSTFLRRFGMGLALPHPYPISHILRSRYILSAPTISELARKMRVEESNLVATVERFNDFARQGHDPDFHRGEAIYDQFYGDPETRPNPCLAPLMKPPFYALALYPGNVSTLYGLEANVHSQVLDKSGNPVPGLYAVGADQNNVMMGRYPGGGCTLGPGMVFGYRAGIHLAQPS
jgi:succinate dehydrogenase/fumarate reductase flavoprotein subunit